MDTLGVDQLSSTDVQRDVTQLSPVVGSDPAQFDAQGKIINDQETQKFVRRRKGSVGASVSRPSSSSTPANDPHARTSSPASRPTVQRTMSASANANRSLQNLSTASSPRTSENIGPSSDSMPAITVVPSSPLTSTHASRSVGPPESLSAITEAPTDEGRENRRTNRRRSGVDAATNHRLSGFFTNLLHIRERDSISSSNAHNTTSTRTHNPPSSSSPTLGGSVMVHARPQLDALPPSLPGPSLTELGLSLSVLTGDLPSHQFTAPTSGTFLSPHYLLLCHAQGLDVLPLVSPPQVQPYALVRRVSFKSVVVMEERGVLVAIAGRRDGVRVYALEEIRKAVEWRIDVELRRELEKNRKVDPKRLIVTSPNSPSENKKMKRKSASIGSLTMTPASTTPGPARAPSVKKRSKTNPPSPMPPVPMLPPSFPPPRLVPRTSVANFHIHRQANSRGMAMSIAEAMGPQRREEGHAQDDREDDKGEWMDDRDIDEEVLVAAGPSGSAALDERTSAISAAAAAAATISETAGLPAATSSGRSRQRHRPTNLNLADSNEHTHRPGLASPAPTLLTLRQTLNQAPPTAQTMTSEPEMEPELHTPNGEVISFAEALLESRLPNAPPLGRASAQPAQAALVTRFPLSRRDPESHGFGGQGLPVSNSMSHLGHSLYGESAHENDTGGIIDADNSDQEGEAENGAQRPASRSGGSLRATNRRHRWSVFDGVFRPSDSARQHELREASEADATRVGTPLTRTLSDATMRGSRSPRTPERRESNAETASSGRDANTQRPAPSSFSRFFSRGSKRRERAASAAAATSSDIPRPGSRMQIAEGKGSGLLLSPLPPQAPPPKLEYVKLPGTKGSVMIKAVETPKKSFLAILCGESGEKVELFAGTYRTALGLSRTFILPDSPKTLELQLQGDDLVEVFLVFAQNVFGLEPATVRVREVRIGRAERRAARRRANRGTMRVPTEDQNQAIEEDVTVTAFVAGSDLGHEDSNLFPNAYSRNDTAAVAPDGMLTPTRAPSAPASATQYTFPSENSTNSLPPLGPPSTPHPDELANAAMLSMGPYTTFQQLTFAPPFPLAALAEECVIPPSYNAVQSYKKRYESDVPDVPVDTEEHIEPTTTHDVQWFYKDPRGVVRGPWASSLMQSWFKDNFLPPDLPVRRDTEENYISLEELQRQSIDPGSPFRPPPPGLAIPVRHGSDLRPEGLNPLLEPVSLLTQEKRFGPPALFYSSRGGHSTSIVDSRGRSVLKGRIHWTSDDQLPPHFHSLGKLGDVRRLETFETSDRTIIVAFRQGGLEAVDLGDAIMTPGDGCRTVYPYFDPPVGTFNRRLNFLWRTGAPVGENVLSFKPSGSISSITDTQSPMSKAAKRRSLNPSLISGVRGAGSKGAPFGDGEEEHGTSVAPDDLLVLGRSNDNIYFCDRSSGRFRLLILSATARDS